MAQPPPGFAPILSPPPPPWRPFPPSVPLPRPPPPSSARPSSIQGRILAGLLIGIVASMIVFTAVCTLCREYRDRRARAAAAAWRWPVPESNGVRVEERQLGRVSAASPAAGLPAFTYSPSLKHNVAGGGEETATCSVCLGALQLGETVRLLPACLHLYHAECIDPWLVAHSTCPICRSDTGLAAGVGRLPPV